MAGVQACQDLQTERYAYDRDYQHPAFSPGRRDRRPADGAGARGRAAHSGGGPGGGGRRVRRGLRRGAARGRAATRCAPWPRAREGDPDRRGPRAGASAQGPRPRRRRSRRGGRRARRLRLGDPAPMGAPNEEPRCTPAGALPARRLDGRLRRGAGGASRARRAQPLAFGDRAPEGELAGRVRALAAPRPLGPALRLRLGRRGVPPGPDGARGRVHARAHRRHTPEGKKELVGFQVGVRESAQSWRELLVDIKARGLAAAPEIAVGDGAMGFWKALDEVFPGARHQRCWVHKAAQRLEQGPPVGPAGHEGGAARGPRRPRPRRGPRRRGGLRREVRRQVPQGGRVPAEGPGGAARLLRLPRPSTGTTCAPPTPSRASSPPSGTGPCGPRAPCRRPRRG